MLTYKHICCIINLFRKKEGSKMQKKLFLERKIERSMTQKDMADLLGISVMTYKRKESGEYPFNQDEMFKIAELFNVKIDELFEDRKPVL